jgi:hypothetical protein
VIIPGALAGAWAYLRQDSADVRLGVLLGLVGAVASVAGAWATRIVGGPIVLMGTAVIILVAAADMALQVFRPPASSGLGQAVGGTDSKHGWLAVTIIGLATGAYSGFFGLGGGFILVPLLARWLRLPLRRAIGTSLVTVAILAVPGTVAHAALGNIDWRLVFTLVVGVVPGALLGARLNRAVSEAGVRIMFALMLACVAVWLVVNEVMHLS